MDKVCITFRKRKRSEIVMHKMKKVALKILKTNLDVDFKKYYCRQSDELSTESVDSVDKSVDSLKKGLFDSFSIPSDRQIVSYDMKPTGESYFHESRHFLLKMLVIILLNFH